jgi:FAD/FMN-containing dehydrogenase
MTTEIQVMAPLARNLLADLPAGRVLSGSAYEASVRIWNAAVTHEPALIVRPESPAEVRAAVLAARNHDMALSVRGGGHDWAGRSLRHGGLVIDMSGMKHVAVDAHARVTTVQGGVTASKVIAVAQPYGLAAVTGTIGAVGITGLTLGGGYGPLNGRSGLALDNLLRAEVVLADGRHVTATPTEEPELYWALRGGGGNFGVATSLTLQLHHVPSVLAGLIVYPWSQAADVWTRIDEALADCPDELTVQTGVLPGPDGPTLFLSPVWSGQPAQGERAIAELLRLGDPLSTQVALMSYADMLRLFDAHIVTGRHYAMRTRTVANYSTDVIAGLIDAGDSKTSPLSGIVVHHFHGAATRVPVEETAFGIRRSHYMIEILAAWEPNDQGARHRDWTHGIANNLARHALSGGYPNMLGPTDHEQIAHAYGPNGPRLRAAKNRFDPDGIFSAIPLPPHATGYTQGQPGEQSAASAPDRGSGPGLRAVTR